MDMMELTLYVYVSLFYLTLTEKFFSFYACRNHIIKPVALQSNSCFSSWWVLHQFVYNIEP